MAIETLRSTTGANGYKRQRMFPGCWGPRPDNLGIKRKEAIERQEAWDSLTPQQKLDALDRRLGKGVGAKRQRAVLAKLLNVQKSVVVTQDIVTNEEAKPATKRHNKKQT